MRKKDLPYLHITKYHRAGNKDSLLETIFALRKTHCGYSGAPCDCKFGATISSLGRGEQTGCPELATLASLLIRMTETEYKEILSRNIAIVPVED